MTVMGAGEKGLQMYVPQAQSEEPGWQQVEAVIVILGVVVVVVLCGVVVMFDAANLKEMENWALNVCCSELMLYTDSGSLNLFVLAMMRPTFHEASLPPSRRM